MKLYRVEVRLEKQGIDPLYGGTPFAAIGETAEEAARHALAAYVSDAWMGDPAPLGAIAIELTTAAVSMDDAVHSIDRDALEKLVQRPDWIAYEPPAAVNRP